MSLTVMRLLRSQHGQSERLQHGKNLRHHQHAMTIPAIDPHAGERAKQKKSESDRRNATRPSRKAEWVSRYTSQLVAMRVIQVPMSETVWPAKNSAVVAMPQRADGELPIRGSSIVIGYCG